MFPHGQIIDLTQPINESIATWDTNDSFHLKTTLNYGECTTPVKFRVQQMATPAGIGTHIDAPAHCCEGGLCVNDIPLEKLMVPAVMIDVSKLASNTYSVSEQELLAFETDHGEIPPKSFVILYTGWSTRWNTPAAYRNEDTKGVMHFPTVSTAAAEFLIKRDVVGIGIDTLSPDSHSNEYAIHKMFLQANRYIVENIANGNRLPAVGAFVIILPMKIEKGTEAPVRMVAIVP